jgi:LPS export ABC transporter protein LptC
MKKTVAALLVVAAVGAAVWFGTVRRTPPQAAAEAVTPEDRYTFEAQSVVLRQLDAQGKLQYEIEAERIVQLADGDVEATQLTFNHEPSGAAGRAPRRWTLTASAGTFPAAGGTVHLEGEVRAQGSRVGDGAPLIITAAKLNYDLEEEVVCAEGNVEARDGGIYARSQGACVNIATGRLTVESGNGKISL